jgi:hypothetical protein
VAADNDHCYSLVHQQVVPVVVQVLLVVLPPSSHHMWASFLSLVFAVPDNQYHFPFLNCIIN